MRYVHILLIALLLATASPFNSPTLQAATTKFDQIHHFIVIYQENWSFDGLYGKFPGANGIANAGDAVKQVALNNQPYTVLPQPKISGKIDARFPATLTVAPFDASVYVSPTQTTGDLVHRYYQEQMQINGGKMDKFVAISDAAGLAMSYYDATNLPEGKLAQQYVMADNFFHAAFGGSFLNHQWLICACTPKWDSAPASLRAQVTISGSTVLTLTKDGQVTPDGFAINTSFTINKPHPATITDTAKLVPNLTAPTIGDRLSDKGISWAWYSGGWNDALAGKPNALFQYHHQPFAFYANYADGTAAKAQHLKDEKDFFTDLITGTLPSVVFIKPLGPDNEHPGYATLQQGQQHVADIVKAVQNSRYWADTAIIITYDENGGRWDHVAPPNAATDGAKADKWGPGTRVPTIIISPWAKKGFVDHTHYDTTSILRTLEVRYGLAALGTRDAAVNDLSNAFDFTQKPFASYLPRVSK